MKKIRTNSKLKNSKILGSFSVQNIQMYHNKRIISTLQSIARMGISKKMLGSNRFNLAFLVGISVWLTKAQCSPFK